MPVFAYDVPPHLYVRLAPGIGADLFVVGPLEKGVYEALLSDSNLVGGLHQSQLTQVVLDVSSLETLDADALRWTAESWAPYLHAGGMQQLALVVPAALAGLTEELRQLAVPHAPSLALGAFPDPTTAVRWMASRLPGVGSSTTPDEVRADAQQGNWALAVARYRAAYPTALASALEVIEAMVQQPPENAGGLSPTSLVPSTEVPEEAAAAVAPIVVIANPLPDAPSEDPPTLTETDAPAAPSSPTVSPAVTRASLGDQAVVATLAVKPVFEDQLTAHGASTLFGEEEVESESDLLENRHQGAFDALLRSVLSRTWHVASTDGETPQVEFDDGTRGVRAHATARPGASLALRGEGLMALLDDACEQVRFCPDRAEEVTLRKHQLANARAFLSGLQVEAQLDQASSDEARSRCLAHTYLILLERSGSDYQPAPIASPTGGRAAVVCTLPDALHRLLRQRPSELVGRALAAHVETGDTLFEKLLTLPLDGVLLNPAGPSPLHLDRTRLDAMLRAGPRSLPRPVGSSRRAPAAPDASSSSDDRASPAAPAPSGEPSPSARSSVPPAPAEAPRRASPSIPEPAPASVGAMSVGEADLLPDGPLRARSLAEAHFYLDVRGQDRQDRYQWTEERGGQTLVTFQTRGQDGQTQRFDFTLDTPAAAPHEGYFGAGTSPLFGPIELLTLAGAMARSASATPYGLSPEELTQSTHRMEMAYILVMEALRFYGASDDLPPASSLRTDEERREFAREPAQYQRARVDEVARSYWHLASQLGEALRGRG